MLATSTTTITTSQQQVAEATILSTEPNLPTLPVNIAANGTFVNELDGFKVTVPQGWSAEDYDNTQSGLKASEELIGTVVLAKICREYTPSGLGGTNQCVDNPGMGDVTITRLGELKARPEVQSLILNQGKNITTQDLLTLYTNGLTSAVSDDVRIWNSTDLSPNVKLVELAFANLYGNFQKSFVLFVLSPDQNTGYVLASSGFPASKQLKMPAETKQIFDSFEVIPMTTTNMTTTLAG